MKRKIAILSILLPTISFAQTVAILEFKDKGSPPSIVAPDVVHRLFTDLFPPEEFTLIDRDLIRKILPTKTLDELGEITPSVAILLGQVLGADIIISGSYQEISGGGKIRGSIFINADFIDTSRTPLEEGISKRIMDLFWHRFGREGLVEAVTDKIIILNVGGFHGVRIGDRFIVTRGEDVIGKIQVSRVERYMSEAMVVEGKEALMVGDIVRRIPLDTLPKRLKRVLIIDSEPLGASLIFNGQARGLTPIIIYEPAPGVHRIELGKEEYRPFVEELIIDDRKTPFLSIGLLLTRLEKKDHIPPKRASEIIVSSIPSNAKVYLERELKGLTPITLTGLGPGSYKIKVAKTGFETIEHTVVLKEMEIKRLNLSLKPVPPLPLRRPPKKPLPPPPVIIQVPTPYVQGLEDWYLSIGYPDIVEFRKGLVIDGLEARIEGLGLGTKYQFKGLKVRVNLAVDLYYGLMDIPRNIEKRVIDLKGIFGLPIDTGFGIINLTGGAGLRGRDLSYFAGFDSYLTPRLKLLLEYDRFDGVALGLRYEFSHGMRFTLGGGFEPDRRTRLDAYLSIQR